MMISPTDLTYFIEVAQTKNLSRAAERVGISQPSLTLAIQRIETSLGTNILLRSKKGVSLTPAGKKLLSHAKSLLSYWEDIKSEALASTNSISGHISLGCHPSVGLYTLDKFIPGLFNDYENLEISLIHDVSRKIVEQVVSMEIDLGLVINPVKHPDLIIHTLLEDTVTLWTNGEKLKSNDYKIGSAILICDQNLLQTQDLLKKLKDSGISYSRIVTSSSLENITNLVASGAGIGIIPTRIAKKLDEDRLKAISTAPKFKDILCLIYRMENKNIKAFQYISSEIIKKIK